MPFGQLESALQGKTTTSIQKTKQNEESVVRKLMLDMWNQVSCTCICIEPALLVPPKKCSPYILPNTAAIYYCITFSFRAYFPILKSDYKILQ